MDTITRSQIDEIITTREIKINGKIKKIHSFHLDIVYKNIQELYRAHKLICRSGFIRNLIYIVLKYLKVKYKLVPSGQYKYWFCLTQHLGCKKTKWDYSAMNLYTCINQNKILKQDLIYRLDSDSNNSLTEDKIAKLYDPEVPEIEKTDIIHDEIDFDLYKYNIFNATNLYLKTSIKEIILN
jgi:hypothetical protein